MRFAYADPPYIGQAKARYSKHKDYAGEVDHAELIALLERDYDAWALSLSSPTLRQILLLCPETVRVCPWVKPFCAFKPGVNPAYAWEPVIFHKTRKRTREQDTERDWVAENITLRKGLCGAKPLGFCFWMFDFANLTPEDEFIDLFPGTGIVGEAWKMYCAKKEKEYGRRRTTASSGELSL